MSQTHAQGQESGQDEYDEYEAEQYDEELAAATGSLPVRSAARVFPAGGARYVAQVSVDPHWYAEQEAPEPCPPAGVPMVVDLLDDVVLIGRRSAKSGAEPLVDCGHDTGVSRRHAELSTDGTRWWIEDLQSANGTFIGTGNGSFPEFPIAPGLRRELLPGEKIYLGAWTRVEVRHALTGE